MDKKNILKIIFSLIIGLVLATFCMLKYIYVKFHGYDNLIKVLDNVTGYDATYMNFGYWGGRENKETLTEANKTSCEHMISKIEIKDTDKILDVGCGYGDQDILINNKHSKCNIDCIDINPLQIDKLNNRLQEAKLTKKINARVGSATELPSEDNKYDILFSIESAFHYDTREKFFDESYRVLKNNGKMVIADIVLKDNYFLNFPVYITKQFFEIPQDNLITKEKWIKQLEDRGFSVQYTDITDNTFIPYFNYFKQNHSFNNIILDKIIDLIVMYMTAYCPFKYMTAVATK